MANPLRDFFFGTVQPKKELVEAIVPRRTFDDVILPPGTRRALDQALVQIKKRDLIFGQWGLAERHNTGLGLAFNFAGPPGTGKTVCAEAIAHALGKRLLVVRYSEMESLWAGETGKNVSAVFRAAAENDAVLFFDEADAIAGRRFASVTQGYQREANTVVNVLLKELEAFDGVVIFATNMAANFDPAFERRIRTHILFEMPDEETRARIWRVQLHARKTPLGTDVDFQKLAQMFPDVSGGDIKNAVLKAAQMATAEPGPDVEKRIYQRHFEVGMNDVLAAKRVMEQSIYSETGDGSHALSALASMNGAWSQLAENQANLEEGFNILAQRLGDVESHLASFPAIIERFDDASRKAHLQLRDELSGKLGVLEGSLADTSKALHEVREQSVALQPRLETVEKSHEQLTGQVAQLPGQVEVKLQEGLGASRKEWQTALQSRAEELAQATHRVHLSLALSVAAIVAAICALVFTFYWH